MEPIRYMDGDATAPEATGNKIIVHVCNDVGGWGKGFVLALSKRWPEPEAEYRRWFAQAGSLLLELGRVQFVNVEPDIWVANLIGQRDIRPRGGVPPVRYEAIRQGLEAVRDFARDKNASIHMPRIGSGLAGGEWEEIGQIVREELADYDLSVTVYDFS